MGSWFVPSKFFIAKDNFRKGSPKAWESRLWGAFILLLPNEAVLDAHKLELVGFEHNSAVLMVNKHKDRGF